MTRVPRYGLNMTTGKLDELARLAQAQRDIAEIADALLRSRTSKREHREDMGRKLNAVNASLRTVELRIARGHDT